MGVSLVSNPPYNMAWNVPDLAGFMPQYTGWPIPPKNNANFAFVLAGIAKITDRAVFLLPIGVLTSATKEEAEIRKLLIGSNMITAVILLPDSMFESTGIPVCMVIFEKNRKTTKVEMIDLRKHFEKEIRDQRGQYGGNSKTGRVYHKEINVITRGTMEKTVRVIRDHETEIGFCRAVIPETIRKNDYSLNPAAYVEKEAIEEKHRSFEDITADYNRIIETKNRIKIRMNATVAKRLGYDCLDTKKPDLSEAFEVVGQKAMKENYIRFSPDDGIEIRCSTKNGISEMIIMFMNSWKQRIIYLNNEENRLLAEFRDALLPKLMAGEITIPCSWNTRIKQEETDADDDDGTES